MKSTKNSAVLWRISLNYKFLRSYRSIVNQSQKLLNGENYVTVHVHQTEELHVDKSNLVQN